MTCDATRILDALQAAATTTRERDALAAAAVAAIRQTLPQATWVGVYWLQAGELVLGPYDGPATEHTRIPVGTGICGTAVAQDEDMLVDDVREVENYLACSATVRSEVVVLIRVGGRIVGQFDLDADDVGAFSLDDLCVLRAAADGFAGLIADGFAS
ncbi:MAG: GAF domain-containing protein [Planctomycetota bacterium]|nr:GAF domain-containing protein [Planctomycetota bacterium]